MTKYSGGIFLDLKERENKRAWLDTDEKLTVTSALECLRFASDMLPVPVAI